MAVPSPSKIDLRKELISRRDRFVLSMNSSLIDRAEISLYNHVLAHMTRGTTVAAYIPIGSEIGTMPLVSALSDRGHAIALPHVASRHDTPRFLAWQPGSPLIEGLLGLRQPEENAAELRPDIILTPLLGFDAELNRIGYGAGHYDRAFVAHPDAIRIGLAWAIQRCERISPDPWDVPLHAVATEKEWIEK
jgi:5-formyltetrahydrofolate cyclo-ligase